AADTAIVGAYRGTGAVSDVPSKELEAPLSQEDIEFSGVSGYIVYERLVQHKPGSKSLDKNLGYQPERYQQKEVHYFGSKTSPKMTLVVLVALEFQSHKENIVRRASLMEKRTVAAFKTQSAEAYKPSEKSLVKTLGEENRRRARSRATFPVYIYPPNSTEGSRGSSVNMCDSFASGQGSDNVNAGRSNICMETLSRREEDALMKSTKARALKECDDIVKVLSSLAGYCFGAVDVSLPHILSSQLLHPFRARTTRQDDLATHPPVQYTTLTMISYNSGLL
ncbi:13397_t:CDS:2, partial [Acaulospora colombiana]